MVDVSKNWVQDVMVANIGLPLELLDFFTTYEQDLLSLGQQTWVDFLKTVQSGDKEKAVLDLVDKMDFAMLAQMMGDVADAEKKLNEMREKWRAMAWNFINLAAPVIIKLLLTVLVV